MGILRGFRNFVMRGNVVDLAVGVVIGAAFNGLVQQLTSSFLQPLIKLLSGGKEFSGKWAVNKDVVFDWSAFLNAVVAFLLTAAALYFLVVLPVNRLHERMARGEEPEPEAPSQEVQLLTQIRDAREVLNTALHKISSQVPNVDELDSITLDDKIDGIALFLAAEAVEILAFWVYMEGRGFLLVKGT